MMKRPGSALRSKHSSVSTYSEAKVNFKKPSTTLEEKK